MHRAIVPVILKMTGEADRAFRELRATHRDVPRRLTPAPIRALSLVEGPGNLKCINKLTSAPLGGSPAARCCLQFLGRLHREVL